MDIRIIGSDFPSKEFDQSVFHPLQSWRWGEARKSLGTEIVRLGEFNGNQLVDAFQISIHPVPYSPYKIGYIPRSVIPSEGIIDYLAEYGRAHQLIFIKFEPYAFVDGDTAKKLSKRLAISPHPLFTPWTQILNLNPSESDLLKNMKSKTRYNIRLAERKGVTVKQEDTDTGFKTFIKLYFETCKRQHYFGHNELYHREVWEHLQGSIAHLLIAYYENIPLAAYELFKFKDHWYYVYGGTSDLHRNLMASNLLMWEAIRLGKELGATTFDMWGSLAPGAEDQHGWSGFTRFKEGYGTEYKQTVGSYDLIINPSLYKIYNAAQNIRNKLLEILPR